MTAYHDRLDAGYYKSTTTPKRKPRKRATAKRKTTKRTTRKP